jgi:hypothetical protein
MALLVGSEERFAAETGEQNEDLRRVAVWSAGQALTCDDNMACVFQLRRVLQLNRIWSRGCRSCQRGAGMTMLFA